MNLAISNIAWELEQESEIYSLTKKFGFTGVEIAPTKVWNKPLLQGRETINDYKNSWIKERKVSIVATQSTLFGHPEYTIFENKKTRQATLAYLKKMIVVTSQFGARVLVFGSPKNRSIQYENTKQKKSIAIDFFYELAEFSKIHDVYFCIEPNPTFYQCNFVTNTQEAIAFIKIVNHPFFQLHLDSGALFLNKENYERSIYEGFPYLKHFHISEPYLDIIGSHDIPHALIAKVLRQLKYKNWVSIEMKSLENNNNIANVRSALQLVSHIYG